MGAKFQCSSMERKRCLAVRSLQSCASSHVQRKSNFVHTSQKPPKPKIASASVAQRVEEFTRRCNELKSRSPPRLIPWVRSSPQVPTHHGEKPLLLSRHEVMAIRSWRQF